MDRRAEGIIEETSRGRIAWDVGILLLVLLSCALIPYELAFDREAASWSSTIFLFMEVIFLADIYSNFRTSFRKGGVVVRDREVIRRRYLRTYFPFDAAANLPVELIVFSLGLGDESIHGISWLLVVRTLHLFRLGRLFAITRRWEEVGAIAVGYLRLGRFVALVGVLLHAVACLWFLLAYWDGFPENSWVAQMGVVDAPPEVQYVRSLWWTVILLGNGDVQPNRQVEFVFATTVILLGASLFAYLIGSIASIVSNLDAARADYVNRMEAASVYLRDKNAPPEVVARVRGYYQYMWARHRGVGQNELLEDLAEPMRLDVLLHITRELFEQVPLFRLSSPPLRNELLKAIETQVFAPGSYLTREGEPGQSIYFITRGQVEIVAGEGEAPHGMLGPGDSFGEVSMVLGERRSGSVKAIDYTETFLLRRADFEAIRREHAEFADVLKEVAKNRSELTQELLLDGIVL